MTEFEFELADPSYFFVGLSEEACLVRLEETLRLADDSLVEFFAVDDCDAETIHDRADRCSTIDSARIMSTDGPETLFRVTVSGRCVAETIETAGALPRSVLAVDGSGRVIAQVPRCVRPGQVVETVCDHHPALELVARRRLDVSTPVFTPRGARQLVRDRLTSRQWEVLRTAHRNGYFERPRQHTGEEIADMLDISSATFSQHLRAAQRNLLSLLVVDADGNDGA